MIRINLLGIREKPKKPIKRKEKKRKLSTKTIFYIIILLFVIVVLFIPTYFPDLFNFISSKLKDKLIIPEQVQVEVPEKAVSAVDTAQKLAVKEEAPPEIEPEKKVQKPEIPKPVVKTEDYLKMVYINNQMEIDGFSALRRAVSKGIEYTLITVNEGYFISEIITTSKDEIAQYDINLKSGIPEGGIKIIGVNETVETKKLIAQIWGYLNSYKGMLEKPESPFKEFYKPSEIISKIRGIGKKNGFVVKSYAIQKTFEQGNFKKSPVLLKLQGYDENSINFLKSLKKENLNIFIQKISGVPELDKKSVSIAISLEVFVPST